MILVALLSPAAADPRRIAPPMCHYSCEDATGDPGPRPLDPTDADSLQTSVSNCVAAGFGAIIEGPPDDDGPGGTLPCPTAVNLALKPSDTGTAFLAIERVPSLGTVHIAGGKLSKLYLGGTTGDELKVSNTSILDVELGDGAWERARFRDVEMDSFDAGKARFGRPMQVAGVPPSARPDCPDWGDPAAAGLWINRGVSNFVALDGTTGHCLRVLDHATKTLAATGTWDSIDLSQLRGRDEDRVRLVQVVVDLDYLNLWSVAAKTLDVSPSGSARPLSRLDAASLRAEILSVQGVALGCAVLKSAEVSDLRLRPAPWPWGTAHPPICRPTKATDADGDVALDVTGARITRWVIGGAALGGSAEFLNVGGARVEESYIERDNREVDAPGTLLAYLLDDPSQVGNTVGDALNVRPNAANQALMAQAVLHARFGPFLASAMWLVLGGWEPQWYALGLVIVWLLSACWAHSLAGALAAEGKYSLFDAGGMALDWMLPKLVDLGYRSRVQLAPGQARVWGALTTVCGYALGLLFLWSSRAYFLPLIGALPSWE